MLVKYLPLIFLPCVLGFPKKVHIGGLFDDEAGIRRTFETSIKAVNKERHVRKEFSNVFLMAESNEVGTDPFEVSQKGSPRNMCRVYATRRKYRIFMVDGNPLNLVAKG